MLRFLVVGAYVFVYYRYTRRRQDAPEGARRHKEAPGGARRRQKTPGGASRRQETPGGARRRGQERQGKARRSSREAPQETPGEQKEQSSKKTQSRNPAKDQQIVSL